MDQHRNQDNIKFRPSFEGKATLLISTFHLGRFHSLGLWMIPPVKPCNLNLRGQFMDVQENDYPTGIKEFFCHIQGTLFEFYTVHCRYCMDLILLFVVKPILRWRDYMIVKISS